MSQGLSLHCSSLRAVFSHRRLWCQRLISSNNSYLPCFSSKATKESTRFCLLIICSAQQCSNAAWTGTGTLFFFFYPSFLPPTTTPLTSSFSLTDSFIGLCSECVLYWVKSWKWNLKRSHGGLCMKAQHKTRANNTCGCLGTGHYFDVMCLLCWISSPLD